MKAFHLLVIRARHDTSVSSLSDAACLSAIMTGPNSLFAYWKSTSQDFFDLTGSSMLPWVDIAVAADVSRGTVGQLAIDAARRLPGPDPLAQADGVLVLLHPGARQIPNPSPGPGQPTTITQGFDGGTTGLGGKQVAVIPLSTSDFTFMSHETGHVLGFRHSFGLLNNGTDWNGAAPPVIEGNEYGSPYDLMSSATFGSRWEGAGPFWSASPTMALPVIAGWPQNRQAGPHMSRANLHFHFPAALAGSVVDRAYPTASSNVSVRLWAPERNNGPRLLALHPPGEPANGAGRVYVEFRPSAGWDSGLKASSADLAREGLVVHEIVGVPGTGERTWYKCSIPTHSIDRDAMVANHAMVVEAVSVDPAGAFADVVVRASAVPAIEVVELRRLLVGSGISSSSTRRTPCLDEITVHTETTRTTASFRARVTGLGAAGAPFAEPVKLAWSVGGVALPAASGNVPVSYGGKSFSLQYAITGELEDLELSSHDADSFNVEVLAKASDQMQFATGSRTFSAAGSRSWISDEDSKKLALCRKRFQRYIEVQVPWWRVPIPDPPPWDKVSNPLQLAAEWKAAVSHELTKVPNIESETRAGLDHLVELSTISVGRLQSSAKE